MYDQKAIRRRRATLAVLVALSIGLLTIFFGDSAGGRLQVLQRGVQVVLGPIETGVSVALKPLRDAIGWTGNVLSAQSENERLAGEVAKLRRELAQAQTRGKAAAQVRALEKLSRRPAYPDGVDPVTARVIAQSPTVWYSRVRIDKGTNDGVRVDQPVVSGDGLVGKVTRATGGSAIVTLITDESSAVSAQVMPDSTRGVIKPELGKPQDLLLEFIDPKQRVRKGALVASAGISSSKLESLFPRGIPIGEVQRVDSGEVDLYQRVHVKPFADMRRLDFVQVLTDRPDLEQAEVGLP